MNKEDDKIQTLLKEHNKNELAEQLLKAWSKIESMRDEAHSQSNDYNSLKERLLQNIKEKDDIKDSKDRTILGKERHIAYLQGMLKEINGSRLVRADSILQADNSAEIDHAKPKTFDPW